MAGLTDIRGANMPGALACSRGTVMTGGTTPNGLSVIHARQRRPTSR